jgi:NADPH2:quinone reductase
LRRREETMMGKAFRFYQHGGPEVMLWEDVDLPPPGAGQVRMRNTAVAVNYRDVLIRRGSHEVRTFPSGIGLESAGVVEAVGPDAMDIGVGDRIAWPGRTARMRRCAMCRRRAR